ncbi:hypothetical protein GQ457_04G022470 [Hibiscus cannabinus]
MLSNFTIRHQSCYQKLPQNYNYSQGDTRFIYGGKINGGFYAIKRLMPTTDSHLPLRKMRHGAEFLCQLHHPNILSLISFYNEKNKIIHAESYDPIPWKRRLDICISVAQALQYLHTKAKEPLSISRGIVSLEVQPDVNYTFECLALDVAMTCRVSDKCDVFSFRVFLFEVVCRRRIFDAEMGMDQRLLYHLARKCIENGIVYSIIDPYLKGKIARECLKKFLEIAYSCVQYEVNKRPTMGEVELTLELVLELQKQEESEFESMNLCLKKHLFHVLFNCFLLCW